MAIAIWGFWGSILADKELNNKTNRREDKIMETNKSILGYPTEPQLLGIAKRLLDTTKHTNNDYWKKRDLVLKDATQELFREALLAMGYHFVQVETEPLSARSFPDEVNSLGGHNFCTVNHRGGQRVAARASVSFNILLGRAIQLGAKKKSPDMPVDEFATQIVDLIKSLRPLRVITVNAQGESIRQPSSGDLLKDSYPLQCMDDDVIGEHLVCDGNVHFLRVSLTHDVLLCRRCGLRVHIPKTLKTYGDLRKCFSGFGNPD